jgi:3-deoxy-D-manno-octulosonic acid kinase
MIREQILQVPRGGILYDAARLRKPEPEMFTRAYWQARDALESFAGGRGTVCIVHAEEGDWVLRHYHRGGLAARMSRDRYLWLGANATRAFREWRLLARLHEQGLPVPAPIAAHFERGLLSYRADIMTARLANARTLAQVLQDSGLEETAWRNVGRTIARFHCAGVHHADLNANNIMLAQGEVYLIDFDRGRIRERGPWEQDVIARLRRSLDKLRATDSRSHFAEENWSALLEGLRG